MATATKSTPRRYTLNRRKREFLTNSIMPLYTERMRENINSMQQIAATGGTDLITADAARFMAQQFEMNIELAQEIISDLSSENDE
jgi:hypothetical protein